ncbi:MAG TPA: signal recognition particle-docking protein FtsY [Desulfobacteria bacterium]|nr:signal recognition particle-docking protein FtsY [Desulfobacteria bacterium]
MAGLFARLKEGLTKTRQGLVGKVEELITGRKRIDEELYEELEEVLIQGDVGAETSFQLVDNLRRKVKERKVDDPNALKDIIQEEIEGILQTADSGLNWQAGGLTVILVVGVNGVGKTTTIGKLAHKFKEQGKRVILGAGDTFRAAAIDQLEIWGNRVGIEVIKHQEGADPAAVAFDALQAAKSRQADVLLIDTAGRLHNKANLMEELRKVTRVIGRELPGAPHEVLLVLDATTGQNAIAQAKLFSEVAGVTGIVLTKLDGTARGGVIIGIKHELKLPVKFIGIGEGVEDLREFEARDFAAAMFMAR